MSANSNKYLEDYLFAMLSILRFNTVGIGVYE